jgi:hypothetical protein
MPTTAYSKNVRWFGYFVYSLGWERGVLESALPHLLPGFIVLDSKLSGPTRFKFQRTLVKSNIRLLCGDLYNSQADRPVHDTGVDWIYLFRQRIETNV